MEVKLIAEAPRLSLSSKGNHMPSRQTIGAGTILLLWNLILTFSTRYANAACHLVALPTSGQLL